MQPEREDSEVSTYTEEVLSRLWSHSGHTQLALMTWII